MSTFWRTRIATLLVTLAVTFAYTGDIGMASQLSLCLVIANTITLYVTLRKL